MNASPRWFKIVAVLALLWNLLGCLAFGFDLSLSAEDIAGLTEAQRALHDARPAWSVVGTGLAVVAGALGCVGLLLGRKWALIMFVLSLIGVVIQDIALFVLVDGATLAGPVAVVMQTIVLLIGIGLVLLARKGIARGWLT